jgi:hypothetical protein
MRGMPVPRQADPHTCVDAANDPALMAIRRMGAEHPGSILQGRQRIPVFVRRHRQVHQVAGNNPCDQDQQAVHSQVHQIHRLRVWDPKQDHHRQQVPVHQQCVPRIL